MGGVRQVPAAEEAAAGIGRESWGCRRTSCLEWARESKRRTCGKVGVKKRVRNKQGRTCTCFIMRLFVLFTITDYF